MVYYIIVTGGVISGLGKGITASSIGLLLKGYGFKVTAIKIDPYLNFDSGTMSPWQHGECYVLNDGGETDLDLGNYERFLDINLTSDHSLTTGKVFKKVIDKERKGDYLGNTVQMVPHVTDLIQDHIDRTSRVCVSDGCDKEPDICIVEIGGTVGDHEGVLYYEALSEFASSHECCFVHVSLIPVVHGSEIKTKPTQHSIRSLRSLGISPDLLILRCDRLLDSVEISKVSKFCKIKESNVLINENVDTIYRVPSTFLRQGIVNKILNVLNIRSLPKDIPDFEDYNRIMRYFNEPPEIVITVTVVGKYIGMQDTYLSLIRAIEHACFRLDVRSNIVWVDSEKCEDELIEYIKSSDCTIIPGGFGNRGIDGMVHVSRWCRENNHPLLGICLGMQIMCIELDRSINHHPFATSEEFDNDDSRIHTVILSNSVENNLGATMRLGSYRCKLTPGSFVYKLYGNKQYVSERHRHRYEVSSRFVSELESSSDKGVVFSGHDVRGRYPELLEHLHHRFFVGCQFHPEFLSRHMSPHPLFVGLLHSCLQ